MPPSTTVPQSFAPRRFRALAAISGAIAGSVGFVWIICTTASFGFIILNPETCHVVGFRFWGSGGTKYSRKLPPLHLGARYANYDAEVLVRHDRHASPVGPCPCFGYVGPNILFIRTVTTGHGLARVLLAGRPRGH